MSQYFDKDFFKFFLRFAAIVSLSLIIILAARMYQDRQYTSSTDQTTEDSVSI